MLEQAILGKKRESLPSQSSFFEGMGKGGQISFPLLGCSRGSKASQISVAYRFIPLCVTLTH